MNLIEVIPSCEGLLPVLLLLTFVMLVCSLRDLFRSLRKAVPRVRGKALMTPNEQEFYWRLKRALSDYDVMAQVAMSALIDAAVPESHPDYWTIRKGFSQKNVDYVVYRRETNAVVALVELDDRTHSLRKDSLRDALTRAAGLITLRYESRSKPSEARILQDIQSLQSPRRVSSKVA